MVHIKCFADSVACYPDFKVDDPVKRKCLLLYTEVFFSLFIRTFKWILCKVLITFWQLLLSSWLWIEIRIKLIDWIDNLFLLRFPHGIILKFLMSDVNWQFFLFANMNVEGSFSCCYKRCLKYKPSHQNASALEQDKDFNNFLFRKYSCFCKVDENLHVIQQALNPLL